MNALKPAVNLTAGTFYHRARLLRLGCAVCHHNQPGGEADALAGAAGTSQSRTRSGCCGASGSWPGLSEGTWFSQYASTSPTLGVDLGHCVLPPADSPGLPLADVDCLPAGAERRCLRAGRRGHGRRLAPRRAGRQRLFGTRRSSVPFRASGPRCSYSAARYSGCPGSVRHAYAESVSGVERPFASMFLAAAAAVCVVTGADATAVG